MGTRAETVRLHFVLVMFSTVIASRIANAILESIVGPKPMSRRTEPVPMENGGASPTGPTLVIIRDETSVEESVRSPYVRRGHDSKKGLVERSPVGLVLGLNQALQGVNPRDRTRAETAQKRVIGCNPCLGLVQK